MSETLLERDRLDALVQALLRVPGLEDSDVRDERVNELEHGLRRRFSVDRFQNALHDLASLVNASAAHSGALRLLAQIVQRHHPGAQSEKVSELTAEIVGPLLLSSADREALHGHLAGIGVAQMAEAVGELVDAAELRSMTSWLNANIPASIRAIEMLPLPDDDLPQLITFTNRLAHVVRGPKADDLRRWVDTVAGGLGVDSDRLARLRAETERQTGESWRLAAPSQRLGSSLESAPRPRRSSDAGLIWGGVPIRNRNFTGRLALLEQLYEALRSNSKASVVPQTLHGMGGVGKTQLVIEYVYRHLEEYDLVWWIPAEQTSSVLSSLTQLAERLGLVITEDRVQTARTALDALASGELAWLLVYDNADDLAALDQLVPSSGGHVVLTTRNLEWKTVGMAIEVDVFQRSESIELLQRRSADEGGSLRIRTAEADQLAEKLGDLPLALEQAAAWCLATAMPVGEYIQLLDSQIRDLLSEGKPANYPLTVAAFVSLAVQKLREDAPATAQLFELMAYLGGEPVAVSLLRRGRDAEITEPLRGMLGASIPMNRIVRDLSRFGLAKIDAAQRVQVHRLVQKVLRDSLSEDLAKVTLRNAQNLLAAANPGDPDDYGETSHIRQREMGPHLEPARMIYAENLDARQAVLDHTRYLYVTGDYENSRVLAQQAADAWAVDTSHPRLGADGEMTLSALGHVSNALRTLGDSSGAARMARDVYDRLTGNLELGPRHEFTLIMRNQVGADMRIAGRYWEALAFDEESVALHKAVFGQGETYTLRAQSNLAVDQRMVGNFTEAFRLDREVASHWEDVGGNDQRALAAYINMARSFYGMGAYRAGLEVIERWRPALQESMGSGHSQVLLAERTHAILLRKLGRLDEAAALADENTQRVHKRFGPNHEFSVVSSLTYANVLRQMGQLDSALEQVVSAQKRYEAHFGPQHPLTLIVLVNQAIILRARNELAEARRLDERCYQDLAEVLTPEHPYTVCAGVSLATDFALAGEHAEAARLSAQMLEKSLVAGGHDARGGADHPYRLMRAANLALDLRAIGEVGEADELKAKSLAGLRIVLGENHPEVRQVEQEQRSEGDIEPPPT